MVSYRGHAVIAAGNENVKLAFRNEVDANVVLPEKVMGAMSIEKIASDCGFYDSNHLNCQFRKNFKCTHFQS